ncbi:FtsX-like permease family protein [Neobacillus sp. MER 74]|uniref:ABC transporter permease n=1 Tax=Bacillaceae TaxID=186817 RepID=UPI000BF3AB9E|nr:MULTISPECIES: FtsX-like permease family protein [Bacillaceae]MCM3117976.1 FtsX-like permease family protein [Neobacillus sp. MER 74]PFP17539.1 ABC transporter permease [Bacillus sp. AFS073361]
MTFPQFVYRNVVRNKRTYAAYFLSSAFSVMIFFIYALYIFHPDIKKGVTSALAVELMTAAEVIMYVFSFLFVLYSVSTFLKSRKREFGILMMHGMTKGQLNLMVFLENMIIGVGAIIIGIGAGMITGKLFLMIGSKMIGIPPLSFYFSEKALLLTVGAFLILFLCISLFTTILVRVNKLIDLFQAGEKPKKEPKVSVFLSIFSAILLIVSYYLAATATMLTLIFRVLPVIGMTIVGTYFFYTQLSVWVTKLLQKNRFLFWKKTNLVTFSSLAYRLKDNARMFFMVTIVSTVAFCAVGTLASMNVMIKQLDVEFPAEISYLAKDDQPVHQQNLQQIEAELKEKNINYTTNQILIKNVAVASSTDKYAREKIPVVSFSDYKKIAAAAGYEFDEKRLVGNETLEMRTSIFSNLEEVTYTLKQDQIRLTHDQPTKHIVFPNQLLHGQGIVVSDGLFDRLTPVNTETFTGFYTKELKKTTGMAENLVRNGTSMSLEHVPYSITVSGTLYELQMGMYKMMLFVALLIGAVFFIAAGSFLYFRLYADLDYDRRQYLTITKVGLTDRELNKIVTQQLALLFFVPIVVAFVHSGFAFMALQSFYKLSIAKDMIIVLAGFLLAQFIYFFLIRYRYLRNLKKSLI